MQYDVVAAERRVAFLIVGLARGGGAEVQLVRVARGLRARGWAVRVMTLMEAKAYTDELREAGIGYESMGMRRGAYDPRPILRLVRALRRWRPTVLVTFMFHANVVGRLAGRLSRVPVVVSSVRSSAFGGPFRYWLVRVTDALADATTTNARSVADDLVVRGIVAADRMHLTPNAVPATDERLAPEERAALRKSLGVGEADFLWLAVGSLVWHKDYPTLLAAGERLAGEGVPLRIVVAGGGALGDELQARIDAGPAASVVRLLGRREDVPRLLRAADGFVSSSQAEGAPNAVAEAMEAGLPVVATRAGGIPELVADGETGVLVQVGDHEGLAAALRWVTELRADARRVMGEAGRARVNSLHHPERVVDVWESLLLRCIGVRGARAGAA